MRKLVAAGAVLLLAQAPAPSSNALAPSSVAPTSLAPNSPAPNGPPPPAWVARGIADLTVLDKVSARLSPLTVKVGETAQLGRLTIGVRACDVRPSDVAADATVFLDVADSTPGAPDFHAWLVLSAPGVSAIQHPVYDVRLVACR